MGKNFNSKIFEHYSVYKTAIESQKIISHNDILLTEIKNQWKERYVDLFCSSIEGMKFNAGHSTRGPVYGLKIFLKSVCEEPVFYFDSDGPFHINRDDTIPLLKRRIETPHFNYYDENGIKKAKRTDFIEKHEEEIRRDINVGMKHFCEESHILSDRASLPKILVSSQMTFGFNQDEDIHSGINFL